MYRNLSSSFYNCYRHMKYQTDLRISIVTSYDQSMFPSTSFIATQCKLVYCQETFSLPSPFYKCSWPRTYKITLIFSDYFELTKEITWWFTVNRFTQWIVENDSSDSWKQTNATIVCNFWYSNGRLFIIQVVGSIA